MFPGPFAKFLAKTLVISEATIDLHIRRLRAGGHMRKGARGKNAIDVSPSDAANLILAIMISESPTLAAERFEHYSTLPCRDEVFGKGTFAEELADVLQRYSKMTVDEADGLRYTCRLSQTLSWGELQVTSGPDDDGSTSRFFRGPPLVHFIRGPAGTFRAVMRDQFEPFNGAVQRTAEVPWYALHEIARAVGEQE